MDKFQLYHNIKSVQSVTEQYPAAQDVNSELTELANNLSSKIYRVAVIGEFKRGKSSLVNCILGTEILPTDILPTTAVVNRIVYDTEQKIDICYKDGTTTSTSIEALGDYTTKNDLLGALNIREIVVHYPSVFCQNSIELFDTPGLNDDEFMDKTTLDVLDKIDTAIVVTHASYPISQTEQTLICKLLEQKDIYHLTFVITFIDKVSDEVEEQDRIVELVQRRLSVETYQMFAAAHANDQELLLKAQRILCNPVVFAVSSRLAMRGFVTGNKQLLEESRFPHFKYELAALLTANQELDLEMKANRLFKLVKDNFALWHKQLEDKLNEDLVSARSQLQLSQKYQSEGCPGLNNKLLEMDAEIEKQYIFVQNEEQFGNSEYVRYTSWTVLKHLMDIPLSDVNEAAVKKALSDAACQISDAFSNKGIKELIHQQMNAVNLMMLKSEEGVGISTDRFKSRLSNWEKSTQFPTLNSTAFDFADKIPSAYVEKFIREKDCRNLAYLIHEKITLSTYNEYRSMQEQIKTYIVMWRSNILKQNIEDRSEMSTLAAQYAATIRNAIQIQKTMGATYTSNALLLEKIN